MLSRKGGCDFLFLDQFLNLLKIDWLLVLWGFLKIDRWRHHLVFACFEEIDNKILKTPFPIKSKNRVMTSSDSSPLFHWCGYCWKSLDYVWLDLIENNFDFSKNRMMTSSSSRKWVLFDFWGKIFCYTFFDKSWGFLKIERWRHQNHHECFISVWVWKNEWVLFWVKENSIFNFCQIWVEVLLFMKNKLFQKNNQHNY